MMPHLY